MTRELRMLADLVAERLDRDAKLPKADFARRRRKFSILSPPVSINGTSLLRHQTRWHRDRRHAEGICAWHEAAHHSWRDAAADHLRRGCRRDGNHACGRRNTFATCVTSSPEGSSLLPFPRCRSRSSALGRCTDDDIVLRPPAFGADTRLRLPLAGTRAREADTIYEWCVPHRYGAQPRRCGLCGLGHRTRADFLVHSMFEILGLPERNTLMTFGELTRWCIRGCRPLSPGIDVASAAAAPSIMNSA